MKRSVVRIVMAGLLMVSTGAYGDFIYHVDRTMKLGDEGCVVGTITTNEGDDASPLLVSNFVDWNLSLKVGDDEEVTLTPENSDFIACGLGGSCDGVGFGGEVVGTPVVRVGEFLEWDLDSNFMHFSFASFELAGPSHDQFGIVDAFLSGTTQEFVGSENSVGFTELEATHFATSQSISTRSIEHPIEYFLQGLSPWANRNYKRSFGVGGEASNQRTAKFGPLVTDLGWAGVAVGLPHTSGPANVSLRNTFTAINMRKTNV